MLITAGRSSWANTGWTRLLAYLELTKPRLTLLAIVTTVVGFCVGSGAIVDWALLLNTLAGTALLGSGLATLNQWMERSFDARMPRTAGRPLPGGRLEPAEAIFFGAVLLITGTLQLFWSVSGLVGGLASLTAVLYLGGYTPLKRMTPLCTLVGAVPGALPVVMGYTAAAGKIDGGAVVLFAILFLWQLPHFGAIAMIYRDEYRDAGFKMSSVADPQGRLNASLILIGTLALLVATLWPTYAGVASHAYLMIALFLGFIFGAFAFEAVVMYSTEGARRLFLASICYLPILLVFLVWDRVG